MNIFVLDLDPKRCAEYHCNKHVVKMILEYAQLLSTAIQIKSNSTIEGLYKITHKNHPCSVWVRKSRQNFSWLCDLALALCDEYTYRYGKTHKSSEIIKMSRGFVDIFDDLTITPFAQAMPDEYKNDDVVVAYRHLYVGEKKHILDYKKRVVPDWLKTYRQLTDGRAMLEQDMCVCDEPEMVGGSVLCRKCLGNLSVKHLLKQK